MINNIIKIFGKKIKILNMKYKLKLEIRKII